jgi:GTP pyrophosphokinase
MINKIKDYIAVPKFNNYQSLHTTILGLFPFAVEIQIRTQAMHDIAEHGVAAHYIYKDHTNPHATLSEKQALWIKNLHDSVLLYQEDEKKTTTQGNLNIELLEKHIFVYTPKGDVIELSQGSTVLDFAFRVHTDV